MKRPWHASMCVLIAPKVSASNRHRGHVIPTVNSDRRALPRWYR